MKSESEIVTFEFNQDNAYDMNRLNLNRNVLKRLDLIQEESEDLIYFSNDIIIINNKKSIVF
jgi:hypothetical protein